MTPRARGHAPRAGRSSGHALVLGVSASLVFTLALALGASSCFVNDVFDGPTGFPCTKLEDCEEIENPCVQPTCNEGYCGSEPVPDGVGPLTNEPGDCRTRSCVAGEVVDAVDDTDRDDDDPCTADDCEAGESEHTQLDEGEECFIGTSQGSCDADGECVVKCSPTAPCPPHEACATWDCEQGICQRNAVEEGDPEDPLPPLAQTAGDCIRLACEDGEPRPLPDDADVPATLAFDCRSFSCVDGEPVEASAETGAPCGSGLTCDVMDRCRTCTDAVVCDLEDIQCRVAACEMGTCVQNPEEPGSACVLPSDAPGQCNDDAICVECLDSDDCGSTGTVCAANQCINGACERVPVPDLTSCGAGNFCNDGLCVQCVIDQQCGNECCNSGGSCGGCD